MRLPLTTHSHSEQDTEHLGRLLAGRLTAGDVVALVGPLGAGKTCLARGIARGLGTRGPVASPTFALVREYSGGRLPLRHLDLYRLTPEEVAELDWRELFYGPAVTLVEWADRAEDFLPDHAYRVTLTTQPDDTAGDATVEGARRITIAAPAARPELRRPSTAPVAAAPAATGDPDGVLTVRQVRPSGAGPQRVLAIDTSTESRSLALLDQATLWERFWGPGAGDLLAEDLSGAVRTLLEAAGLTPGGLDLVAVATGPGSFTGVKVGMAAAKALAYALRLPIAAVSTLDLLAGSFINPEAAPVTGGDVAQATGGDAASETGGDVATATGHAAGAGDQAILAVIDARRGDVYAAAYRAAAGTPAEATPDPLPLDAAGEPYITLPVPEAVEILASAVLEPPPGRAVLVGSGIHLVRPELEARFKERFTGAAAPTLVVGPCWPRAADLALIARARWLHRPEGIDPFALEPLYLKEPSISKPRGGRR